ncbi:CPBP family intramembrane glutamic endopeptidase [Lacticaseibacillus porcinae]|uniref:CPBP family intramembrane glutamic endopeptidase n=1 Tax=Lacticaseibacillus porcinae TaxID=1123687 RepID=UPI000F7A5A19|nr:CPBP family intramembrane glutamic endopeptidase [Lacticaseibacillus porcinae]
MDKLSWYWRLTLFFILELLLGEVVIGYGTRLLHLAYVPHLLVYKGLELVVILLLNWWLIHQKLHFLNLKWRTWTWLLILWIVVGVVTVRFGHASRIPTGLVVGIVAAATEECMFRGVIFTQLLKHWRNAWAAMLTSGLLFGALHLINLTHQSAGITAIQILQAAGMGVMLAAMYLRSGSLLVPMAFHFSLDYFAVAIHGMSGTPTGSFQILLYGSLFWVMVYLAIAVIIVHGSRKPLKLFDLEGSR